MRRPATEADIVGTFSGVRPLYDDGSKVSAQQVSRDYHLDLQQGSGGAPILSVYGGKITTYRRLAEHALSVLLPQMGLDEGEAWTGSKPLPGGNLPRADFASFNAHALARWPGLPSALVARLAKHYGTRMARILNNAQGPADLGRRFGPQLTFTEVQYLVKNEWARSAEDILWRRTRLGLSLPDSALHDLEDVVAQLAG
jgi:glycerol-3-phosphate dehydrogenase